ncbi:MAG: hypothetical protein HKO66_13490 [Saprospiraceae bacterium]|nr:hypothetical protein [Bacteroidia bacterium]NNE15553.1 hypothetical protein [Saprospiraceae bacterium]NNL93248.1 hypothetical protein [Saprospiraceae bacterium]
MTVLDNIKSSIQLSEELKLYLDEEGDEEYKALVAKFEHAIHEVYEQVANESPLQLIALENYLLDDQFEGLYLPKVLGYSVLRGRVNSNIKYYRPQQHFSDVLEFIINSSNFEQIKQRVGQSIQIGFSLSSDIWITNIIENVTNKRVKTFLQSQKLHKYLDIKLRNTALVKYRKQFQSLNFQTASFPETVSELQLEADSIKDFLIYRAKSEYNNESMTPAIKKMLDQKDFQKHDAYFELNIITALYYDLDKEGKASLLAGLTAMRNNLENANEKFFNFYNEFSVTQKGISIESEKRISDAISRSLDDNITAYFNMIDKVNNVGYIHDDAILAAREFYYKNEGLSLENEAIRKSILSKLSQFLNNLEVSDYTEYFEINKTFSAYMDIFSNQKFNQDLKDLSMKFVKRFLKAHTDKRSKEYQELKKFVKSTFIDYGFMTEKQIVEVFKTKRKPKA